MAINLRSTGVDGGRLDMLTGKTTLDDKNIYSVGDQNEVSGDQQHDGKTPEGQQERYGTSWHRTERDGKYEGIPISMSRLFRVVEGEEVFE